MINVEFWGNGESSTFIVIGIVVLFLLLLFYTVARRLKSIRCCTLETTQTSITEQSPKIEPIPQSNEQSPSDELERLRPVIVAAVIHHRRMQGLGTEA